MTMEIAVSMITETAETAETALQERLPIPIVIMITRMRKTITKRMKISNIRMGIVKIFQKETTV